MIRMKVCQDYSCHGINVHSAFIYTLEDSSAGIKEQWLPACLDEGRSPHPVTRQFRTARSQERHFDIRLFSGRSFGAWSGDVFLGRAQITH